MAEANYAQITVTEIDGGFIQYDIIPHDQTEERSIALLDQNGVLSIRDEDGEYMAIAGTENAEVYDYEPLPELPNFFPQDDNVQTFSDLENSVEIKLSRSENGALVVGISYEDELRDQYISITPADNFGSEHRTLIDNGEIGVIDSIVSPGGEEPQNIPPAFKI